MASEPSNAHAPGRWWEKWANAHSFVPTADGVLIHYVDVGPRDALPVVLVHGWPDMWFGWRHQIEALSPKYRLIVPGMKQNKSIANMRGFGQSSAPRELEAYGGKNVTGDFAALLDALDIEKAVFIGHDWGGAMVWRMCLYHPHRVLAVCGVCTPYTPPHDKYIDIDLVVKLVPQFAYQKVLADAENTGQVFDSAPKRFFTAMFRRNREFAKDVKPLGVVAMINGLKIKVEHPMYSKRSVLLSEDELDYYVEQYSRNGFHSTCHYYGTRKIDFENEKNLPKILPHKTLFIAAANDSVLRPEMAKKMPTVIPNLQMKLVKDAGHWVLWEQKEQVNALLDEWLQTIEKPINNKRHAKL
ncbi:Epoxide hydrolase, partial [Globisporangium splendens]